jgi:hypothetical protein
MSPNPHPAEPGRPAYLPLHHLVATTDDGTASGYGYVAGRHDGELWILEADADGVPTGDAGTVSLDRLVADMPADPQPDPVPERARELFERLTEQLTHEIERTPTEVVGRPAA